MINNPLQFKTNYLTKEYSLIMMLVMEFEIFNTFGCVTFPVLYLYYLGEVGKERERGGEESKLLLKLSCSCRNSMN